MKPLGPRVRGSADDSAPKLKPLTASQAVALRELRTTVETMLQVAPEDRAAGQFQADALLIRATARLATDREGRMALIPSGIDGHWLASVIWSQILLSHYDGGWSRLKLCREPGCRSAFYDRSRNGSGAWHNVRTCGNVNNLRVSRARRKGASRPDL